MQTPIRTTLTFSHNRFDTLDSLLGSTRFNEGMRGARSYLFGQSGLYQLAKKWLLGNVNGIEVTICLVGRRLTFCSEVNRIGEP